MGNNQSQITDNEAAPTYSYHETVLREAQTGYASDGTPAVNDDQDEDSYFSAEESDSVRSSLTPERTRPESSSDENLADSSDDNEETPVEDKERCERHSLGNEVGLHVPVVADRSTTSNQADVCAQHKMHHENDAITSVPVAAIEKSRNSLKDSSDVPTTNADDCLHKKNVTKEDFASSISDHSPLISAQPSQGLALDNTFVRNELSVAQLGKRKMAEDSPREPLIPIKRMLTRSSSKRKRLGYTDTSESEMDEQEKGESRKPHKKGKTVIQSSKKSRRMDRDSMDRDSDERRFGKRRRRRNSGRRFDRESSESFDDTDNHYSNKTRSSQKRRRKYSYDGSSDISDESSRYQKKQRSKRHQTKDTDSDDKLGKVEARKSYKHVSSQCDGKDIHEDISSHQNQETQNPQTDLNSTQNLTTSNILRSCTSLSADVSSTPCHTFKMGDQGLRNSYGKVFPLRLQSQKDTATSLSDLCEENVPVSFNLRETETGPGPTHSKIVNVHSSAWEINKVVIPGEGSLRNIAALINQSPQSKLKRPLLPSESNEFLSIQEDVEVSPFKNVILTPPSTKNMAHSLLEQSAIHKFPVSCDGGERLSDMEVEESDITIESQTNRKSLTFLPPNTRSILRTHQRGKTVTARFRNFLSEKKKNIGENLKSLLAKVQSPPQKQSPSFRPVWQAFTLSDSQTTCPTLRTSHDTLLKPPSTIANRANLQGSLLTSSPHKQVNPELQKVERHYETFVSAANTTQSGQTREQANVGSSPQLHNLRSGVTRSQFVNPGSATTQEFNQMFCTTGSNLPSTSLAANSSVKWLPQTIQYQVLNCCLAGTVDISISTGDIADQKTAGIVNWTDGALTHTVTGCSRSIAAKAGALMRAACNDYIESKGSSLEAPDVLTTPAGGRFERAVEAILHVVEPHQVDGDVDNNRMLMETFANCLRFASERLNLDSISFPLIGNGMFTFTTCVKSFFDAVIIFLTEQSKSCHLSHIQLIIPDITAASLAADLVRVSLERVSVNGLENEAADTFNQYFGDKQHQLIGAANLNLSECSQEQRFTVDRTASGRPRLKRPRF